MNITPYLVINNLTLKLAHLEQQSAIQQVQIQMLQEGNTALRKEVNLHESSTNNTNNRQKQNNN